MSGHINSSHLNAKYPTWISRTVAMAVTAGLCLTFVGPTGAEAGVADDNQVSAAEVADALDGIEEVLSSSPDVAEPAGDGVVAAVSSDALTAVIPAVGSEGVALTVAEGEFKVSLPTDSSGEPAQQLDDGTVVYPSDQGSATAVVAGEHAVQMLTVISSSQAGTDYTYEVDLPAGGRIELTGEGGAVVLGASNEPVLAVPAPWATDAHGAAVDTHFVTDGRSLTQIVEHGRADVAYPVVADPIWLAVSVGIFWWAVRQCGVGAAKDAVVAYAFGARNPWALSGAAAGGCLANLVGGWGILRHMIRIVRW